MGALVLVVIVSWVIFGAVGGAIDTAHPGRGFALGVFLGPAVAASGNPAGWYPHPEYQGQECWWDGSAWTPKRRWQT